MRLRTGIDAEGEPRNKDIVAEDEDNTLQGAAERLSEVVWYGIARRRSQNLGGGVWELGIWALAKPCKEG